MLGDRGFRGFWRRAVEAKVGDLSLDWTIGGTECQQRGLSGILLASVTRSQRKAP